MVGIIDYGVGNLFSLSSSLAAIGEQTVISGSAQALERADQLILPGVGAFEDAAAKLQKSGLADFVRAKAKEGRPLLGICLGMQLLFERSFEYGEHEGLGLLKGQVVPMKGRIPSELKTPHMGWNRLEDIRPDSRLLRALKPETYVYFVHSYYAVDCADSLAAVADYGIPVTAAVEKGNIFGCQFHPEKSGAVGLDILRAFCAVQGA